MRKKIVAGNWKMNKLQDEAMRLCNDILAARNENDIQLILIPPSIYLSNLQKLTFESHIEIGAQNCSSYERGAYTGEISASMLASIGVRYCLVGHSERRQYFGEKEDELSKKVDLLLQNQVSPIYCCGEALEERESSSHFTVVKNQLERGLFHLTPEQMLGCIIAYEPVWAIGTGVTASPEQAQEMHLFIRDVISESYGNDVANKISILYGGSCNPKNAVELFSNKDVDGGLIGGASLKAEDFISIADSF